MTDNERRELYTEFASGQSSFLLQQMLRNLKSPEFKSLTVSTIREATEKELDEKIKSCREAVEKELDKRIKSCRPF